MMTSGFPIVLKSRAFEEANGSSLELSVQKGTEESQPRFGTFHRRLSFLWAPRVAASHFIGTCPELSGCTRAELSQASKHDAMSYEVGGSIRSRIWLCED
jgi:hypothetical protein